MYAVVHGGVDRDLRRMSVEYLSSLPFDGFAIGGSLGRDSNELIELLTFLMPLMPNDRPNHLLGVGDVPSIDGAVPLGVDTFDSTFPTRNARHGQLLTFSSLKETTSFNVLRRSTRGTSNRRARSAVPSVRVALGRVPASPVQGERTEQR